MHRFLVQHVPPVGDVVALSDNEAAHASRVLRLGPGAAVEVFDGRGRAARAVLERGTGTALAARIGAAAAPAPEPSVAMTLVQAVLKGDKMDEVVRDAVMMGASVIVPVVTARTETRLEVIRRGARVERWQRVAVASAKQCGRAVVPVILEPHTLDGRSEWLTAVPAPRLLLVEPGAGAAPVPPKAIAPPASRAASLLVGPEGGWTPDELDALAPVTVPLTLGGRTLRADRAAVVALAALQAVWEER